MGCCLFCGNDATVKVHNKGGTITYCVCESCYRSRKDSFVIIKRQADENPSPSSGQGG